MPLSSEQHKNAPRSHVDTFVTPAEKENLKFVNSERGLVFFDGQCRVRVANQLSLRQKAYGLLYDLYSKMGIIEKKDNGLWLSIYDALPETTTLVAEDDRGSIMGSLTVVFDSPIGLPADDLYEDEINKLRDISGPICEFISLGVNRNGKRSLKTLACLYYCGFLHACMTEKSFTSIITIHSRYETFYCRNFSYEKAGPERNYAKVNGEPTVLLKLSLMQLNRLRKERRIFPFYMFNYSDQEELEFTNRIRKMIRPMTDEEFLNFFIEKTKIWEEATPDQKDFIKKVYPPDEANHDAVSRGLANGFSKQYRYFDDTQNKDSIAV